MFNKHAELKKEIKSQINLANQIFEQGPDRFSNWCSEQSKERLQKLNIFDLYMHDRGVPGFRCFFSSNRQYNPYDEFNGTDYFVITLSDTKTSSKRIAIDWYWVNVILKDRREEEKKRNKIIAENAEKQRLMIQRKVKESLYQSRPK